MNIKGILKTSLIDFPGNICAVIFTGGCNLRCGYCYNGDLVDNNTESETYSEEYVFSFLEKRKNLLDGITISGGEPLLNNGLPNFIKKIKDLGYKIKLDTNGLFPEKLAPILKENLIEYAAIDIKTSPEKYSTLTGTEVDFEKIKESISLLKKSKIEFELRSTCVPGYITTEDLEIIMKEIGKVKNFHLQQFVNENTIAPEFSKIYAYPKKELYKLQETVLQYSDNCQIRGL